MIEKIGTVIGLLIGVFSFGYLKGKQNERNKILKKTVKSFKETKKIKANISKLSLVDKLNKLRRKNK